MWNSNLKDVCNTLLQSGQAHKHHSAPYSGSLMLDQCFTKFVTSCSNLTEEDLLNLNLSMKAYSQINPTLRLPQTITFSLFENDCQLCTIDVEYRVDKMVNGFITNIICISEMNITTVSVLNKASEYRSKRLED